VAFPVRPSTFTSLPASVAATHRFPSASIDIPLKSDLSVGTSCGQLSGARRQFDHDVANSAA